VSTRVAAVLGARCSGHRFGILARVLISRLRSHPFDWPNAQPQSAVGDSAAILVLVPRIIRAVPISAAWAVAMDRPVGAQVEADASAAANGEAVMPIAASAAGDRHALPSPMQLHLW